MANLYPEIEVFDTNRRLCTLDWIRHMPLKFARELKALDLEGLTLGEPRYDFKSNFNAILDKLEADGVIHIRVLSFWELGGGLENECSAENLENISKILSTVTVDHLILKTRTLRGMQKICAHIHAMQVQNPINIYFPEIEYISAHTADKGLRLNDGRSLQEHMLHVCSKFRMRGSEGFHDDTCKLTGITVHLRGRELYCHGPAMESEPNRDRISLKSTQGVWLEDFPQIDVNLDWYMDPRFVGYCRGQGQYISNDLGITTNADWPAEYIRPERRDKRGTKSVCFDSRIGWPDKGRSCILSQHEVGPYDMSSLSEALDEIAPPAGQRHPSVIVAVLDTGILACHKEFKGKIASTMNFVPNEASDIRCDPNGHGTSCAGIVLQTAPFVRLVICKVINNEGQYQPKWAADAIDWLLNDETGPKNYCPVDIISMSFGSDSFDWDLRRAVSEAVVRGKVVVAAASNDGRKKVTNIAFPARFGDVICVGSCNDKGQPSSFTPTGREIDFLAPGEDIPAPSSAGSDCYQIMIGTSESTPTVAGIAAMVISYAEAMGGQGMRSAVCHTAVMREVLRKMASMPGHHDEHMGYGNLDPMRLFKYGPDHFRQVVEEIVGPLPVLQPARRDAETQTDEGSG